MLCKCLTPWLSLAKELKKKIQRKEGEGKARTSRDRSRTRCRTLVIEYKQAAPSDWCTSNKKRWHPFSSRTRSGRKRTPVTEASLLVFLIFTAFLSLVLALVFRFFDRSYTSLGYLQVSLSGSLQDIPLWFWKNRRQIAVQLAPHEVRLFLIVFLTFSLREWIDKTGISWWSSLCLIERTRRERIMNPCNIFLHSLYFSPW